MSAVNGFSNNGFDKRKTHSTPILFLVILAVMAVSLWLLMQSDRDLVILYALNRHRIRTLDGIFIFITDTAYLTALLIPTIILIVAFIRHSVPAKRAAIQTFFSLCTSTVITTALKYCINRERPFVHHRFIEKISTGGSPSFPSGHTADAFTVAFTIVILSDDHLEYIIPVWLWALAVAYSRMALGVHYPSDVVGSIMIGILCAVLCDKVFHRKKKIIV